MKRKLLIIISILLVICLFACGTEKIEGVIVEKIYVPAETHTGWKWGGRNSGFRVYRTRAEYYFIIDTGEEQVRMKVSKKIYEAYSVGDSYTEEA